MTEQRIKRGLTVSQLYSKKRDLHALDGDIAALVGDKIELTGVWLIWGGSNSGKTSFAVQLAKKLTKYGKVIFDSIEEGDGYTFEIALRRVRMEDVEKRIMILIAEPMEDLIQRLSKPKSADIIFIDSLQHSRVRYTQIVEMSKKFPKKLFIFISQAKGKEPKGEDADSTKYMAHVKIWVEGCKAFAQSRYGGQTPYTIWPERASIYWGDQDGINNQNER